ncbi:MAG: type II toxin-antitoxin system VapC family toxin [Lentisphaerae bacterium]|nr:type II toxin-antitoxin system VapC family toxin [Lentisphaerota bacterium]
MKASVYVETSVISYLTGRPSRDVIVAGRQALTIEWWGTCLQRFDAFVSALVVTEAEDGDPSAAQTRLLAIEGIPALDVTDAAKTLAGQMVDGGPIPKEYPEDALHVAVCALNGIDYLVTWNCTHLANATIRRQVERFLERAGYVCPVICTPEELMEE